MGRRPLYDNDGSGVISPEEIAEFNLRYDANARKLPQHFIPVPPGFDKRLDNAELDPMVWTSIRERDAVRDLLTLTPEPTEPSHA